LFGGADTSARNNGWFQRPMTKFNTQSTTQFGRDSAARIVAAFDA
jgi:hypothetical protein